MRPIQDWTERYERDSVVYLPQFLDRATLAAITAVYERGLEYPSPDALNFYPESGTTFFQDAANTPTWADWAALLRSSPMPDLLAGLWGSDGVWYYYEQLFLKEGGETRRTPWHQDASYLPIDGVQVANLWIPLDTVAPEDALEFVPGSHHSTRYSASAFDSEDDTAPADPQSPLPRLPHIEAHRDEWNIVSWACEPGDLIVFDIGLLHGGAGTRHGKRRRTVALRCFGPSAQLQPLTTPGPVADDAIGIVRYHSELSAGDALSSHPAFPRLR